MPTGSQETIPLPDLPGIEPGWELMTVEADRTAGKYTADKLERNEALRDSVVRALAEGLSVRQVARAHSISTNLVLAASRRFGAQIETLKQSLGRDCYDVARLAVERIRDEIDQMPRASLPIVAGVMIDKGSLLTGAPTARVEHNHVADHASLNDWLDSLPRAQPVGPRENSAQKSPAHQVLELPAADAGSAAPDYQSGSAMPKSLIGNASFSVLQQEQQSAADSAPKTEARA